MLPLVILAGGLATRLRPVTEKIPKSMIEVNGKPFLYHQLILFKSKGIKKIHFCLGYLGEMVETYVLKEFGDAFELSFSFDGTPLLGTGGAIVNSFNYLPDTFFVTYGDSFLDIDYQQIQNTFFAENWGNKGLMTIFHNQDQWDSSNVLYENGVLKLYSKQRKTPDMHFIDYGLGILSKHHFDEKKQGEKFDLSVIYENLSVNNDLIGYQIFKRFYEVGSFKGIEDLTKYLNSKS